MTREEAEKRITYQKPPPINSRPKKTTDGMDTRFNSLIELDIHTIGYGTWIQKNCIVSRNGFRLEPSLKEEISNEKAYELYLESLKYIK